MNALLIHNDNLPTVLIKHFESTLKFDIGHSKILEFGFSFDREAHEQLSKILQGRKFNVIFLPFTLSNQNYLELSGLRLALHIRLTKEFNHTHTPIVFIGHETRDQISKLSDYGSLLFTTGIFNTDKFEFENIKEQYKWIIEEWKLKGEDPTLNDQEYLTFLQKIKIDPPSNYDSHHSVANEWALSRNFSMFQPDAQNEEYQILKQCINDLSYIKTLHFKLLEAKNDRQRFSAKKKYTPSINNLKGITLGIIDDEIIKGWGAFYKYLIKKSSGSVVIADFKKEEPKDQLIERLKYWVLNNSRSEKPVNIYIVDLRLHDEDFFVEDSNLSGIEIIKYIKTLNPGIQIIVSTASNKVWNFQQCAQYGVTSFFIKESPEMVNSREETRRELLNFTKEIEKTVKKSFLASLYIQTEAIKADNIFKKSSSEIEFQNSVFGQNGLLDQIYGLLILESSKQTVLNQCLLLCFQILEKYSDLNSIANFGMASSSRLSSGFVWLKNSNSKKDIFINQQNNKISSLFELVEGKLNFQKDTSPKTITSYNVFDKMELRSTYKAGLDASSLVKTISVLQFRDNLPKTDIERIISLRYYRSNIAAHFTGKIDPSAKKITAEEDITFLINVFEKIFANNVDSLHSLKTPLHQIN